MRVLRLLKPSGESRALTSAAVVGRDARCQVLVRDDTASRQHCRLEPTADGGWLLLDLGSSNGTWRNGRKVMRATLASGDELIVGREVFQVEVAPAEDRVPAPAEESAADRPSELSPASGWTRAARLLPRRFW